MILYIYVYNTAILARNIVGIYIRIKRIVFLDFIHRPVSQEQTKLKIIDKR
jgi:hypothetical protein